MGEGGYGVGVAARPAVGTAGAVDVAVVVDPMPPGGAAGVKRASDRVWATVTGAGPDGIPGVGGVLAIGERAPQAVRRRSNVPASPNRRKRYVPLPRRSTARTSFTRSSRSSTRRS